MKKILNKLLLSFDNKDETGFDYKKLTAFFFVGISALLIGAYCIQEIKIFWFGIHIVVKNDLPEFKWVLGICLTFVLVLTYFTNSKSLTEFIYNIKGKIDESKLDQNSDTK